MLVEEAFEVAGVPPHSNRILAVMLLNRRRQYFTATDLVVSSSVPKDNVDTSLAWLIALGWVKKTPTMTQGPRGGKPAHRYKVTVNISVVRNYVNTQLAARLIETNEARVALEGYLDV